MDGLSSSFSFSRHACMPFPPQDRSVVRQRHASMPAKRTGVLRTREEWTDCLLPSRLAGTLACRSHPKTEALSDNGMRACRLNGQECFARGRNGRTVFFLLV